MYPAGWRAVMRRERRRDERATLGGGCARRRGSALGIETDRIGRSELNRCDERERWNQGEDLGVKTERVTGVWPRGWWGCLG